MGSILSRDFVIRFISIILIGPALNGDNAIVIGMDAHRTEKNEEKHYGYKNLIVTDKKSDMIFENLFILLQ